MWRRERFQVLPVEDAPGQDLAVPVCRHPLDGLQQAFRADGRGRIAGPPARAASLELKPAAGNAVPERLVVAPPPGLRERLRPGQHDEIGRASWRERVCQYV